jgi:TPR repeat protein
MRHTVLRFKQAIVIPLALGLASSPAGLQFYGASESYAQTPPAIDSAQQRCDELAGDPGDPSQVGAGVHFAQIKADQALPACQAAAASGQPHYEFLYGRVLQKAEQYQEAFQYYSRAADGGVSGAMHNLGVLYKNGLGVAANNAEAQSWYRRAEDARRAEEAKVLAAKDPAPESEPGGGRAAASDGMRAGSEAETPATDLAASGPTESGVGDSEPPDIPKLTADANRGEQAAMLKLGLYYAEQGSSNNDKQAADWFRKAAEAGNSHGMYYYARTLQRSDDKEAMTWFSKCAKLEDASCEYQLGGEYEKGLGGKGPDYKQAEYWYAKAAQQGSLSAEYSLGMMYAYGRGVAPDATKGKAFFTKVVEDYKRPALVADGSSDLDVEDPYSRSDVRNAARGQLAVLRLPRKESTCTIMTIRQCG